jgi:hypothetical protein
VLALYPDTTSFYRATVVSAPIPGTGMGGPPRPGARAEPGALKGMYRLSFVDDGDEIREVEARMVVMVSVPSRQGALAFSVTVVRMLWVRPAQGKKLGLWSFSDRRQTGVVGLRRKSSDTSRAQRHKFRRSLGTIFSSPRCALTETAMIAVLTGSHRRAEADSPAPMSEHWRDVQACLLFHVSIIDPEVRCDWLPFVQFIISCMFM